MVKIVKSYLTTGLFFTKNGVTRNVGLIELYDNGKIAGEVTENGSRGLVIGVRTLRNSVDALSLAYITAERPDDKIGQNPILSIHKAVLQAQPRYVGNIASLAQEYKGLHYFEFVFVGRALLDCLYADKKAFKPLNAFSRLTLNEIYFLLERKRTLFDGRDNGSLENIACANGQTCVLSLKNRVQ